MVTIVLRIPVLLIRWLLFGRHKKQPVVMVEGKATVRPGYYRPATDDEAKAYLQRLLRCLRRRNRNIHGSVWLEDDRVIVRITVITERPAGYVPFLTKWLGGKPYNQGVSYCLDRRVFVPALSEVRP